jgi:hypothetical protein
MPATPAPTPTDQTPENVKEQAMPPETFALEAALQELSTRRLTRLAARLESTPDVKLSVGSWWPQCPMVLAGFDPRHASPAAPEHHFAAVWDQIAVGRPRWRWLSFPGGPLIARTSDVQLLIRTVNSVLAARHARARADRRAGKAKRHRTVHATLGDLQRPNPPAPLQPSPGPLAQTPRDGDAARSPHAPIAAAR